ncbi:MAG: arginine--tRNA ligase, partial [Proteobacteria bacterium]|nr:arginine--tRNA ligase [Pseudomonadota bacterium]
MRARVSEIINSTLERALADGVLTSPELPCIIVDRSKRVEFGDYATNVAMLLAKGEKRPPREIAEAISKLIEADSVVEKCEVAGPGFINIFLKNSYWTELLTEILTKEGAFGRSDIGKGKKVQVEFVSANPTGPLHIGHGRGAVVGDVLANILLAAGYSVNKEYYINDVGNQMNILANSVHHRYMELLGTKSDFPDNHYKGDYIKDIARELLTKSGEKYRDAEPEDYVEELKVFASGRILDNIKSDLAAFGVEFDTWKSEGSLLKAGL